MSNVIHRATGTSAANTAQTVSTPTGEGNRRVVGIYVAYSAAPTQTGVTVTLNSGAGAGYDTLIDTGTANAQYYTYLTNLEIKDGDVIDVVAPAAGGAITSSVSIYSRPT